MAANWLKIRNEYINGTLSYRKLAQKHGVSVSALEKKARAEKWAERRRRQRDKIEAKVMQKTEERISERIAENEASRIERILELSDLLMEQLETAVTQLDLATTKKKHKIRKVEYKELSAAGKPTKEVVDEKVTIEIVDSIIDRAGLQKLSQALKNLKEINLLDTSEEDEQLKKARTLLGGMDSVIK